MLDSRFYCEYPEDPFTPYETNLHGIVGPARFFIWDAPLFYSENYSRVMKWEVEVKGGDLGTANLSFYTNPFSFVWNRAFYQTDPDTGETIRILAPIGRYMATITAIGGEDREVQAQRDVEIVIGHVGRFAEAKNHGFLISIFEEIQNCVAAKLLLVGDGYLRKQVEDQIHKRGLDSKVIMTGVQADVAGYLQAMDVFVFPSIYEGLPVTLIEAQASGLPCVISDKVPQECMITDLVEQMELGDKVKNWAELAIKLSKQVRNNTKTKIEHKGYDIKQNAIFLMDYYEELIV